MAYRDHVHALCSQRKIPNPIQEENLRIAALLFYDEGNGFMFAVAATEMNRAGRLFVEQALCPRKSISSVVVSSLNRIRADAERFFTPELWEDCGPDKRQLVYGLKTAATVKIIYK